MSRTELGPRLLDALPRLRADLEALVRLESPSDDPTLVSALAAWIRERLVARGIASRTVPCPPAGDALFAQLGSERGGTLLLGHLDTVWPAGTLAEMPLRLEAGRLCGPGIFDMKAGIAAALSALD